MSLHLSRQLRVPTTWGVGIYEMHGKVDGAWLDVVIVEKLLLADLA
jgi:hypothetical protein